MLRCSRVIALWYLFIDLLIYLCVDLSSFPYLNHVSTWAMAGWAQPSSRWLTVESSTLLPTLPIDLVELQLLMKTTPSLDGTALVSSAEL
jgi:hypothetical protein